MIGKNHLKKILLSGGQAIGTYVKSTDPAITEQLCCLGFDCILFDNEHTAMSTETMSSLLRATELYGVTGIVRTRENNAAMILQALDAGSMGVQIPNIRTADDVRQVVRSMYYSPKGNRGFANTTRAAGYGLMPVGEYIQAVMNELLCICYCETREAYENLDDILTVEGLDLVFIGPSDLSQAFGVLGQVGHPLVTSAVDDIISRCKRAGKYVGTVAGSADAARKLFDKGVDLVVLGSDHSFLSARAKEELGKLKNA